MDACSRSFHDHGRIGRQLAVTVYWRAFHYLGFPLGRGPPCCVSAFDLFDLKSKSSPRLVGFSLEDRVFTYDFVSNLFLFLLFNEYEKKI